MKKCSTSPANKEMQIKATMGYHYNLLAQLMKNHDNTKCWQGYREKSIFHTLLMGIQNYISVIFLEYLWQFLTTTKYAITIWSSNWILGHLPQRSENLCLHKNTQTNVDSSLIYYIVKGWGNPNMLQQVNDQTNHEKRQKVSMWGDGYVLIN